MHFNAHALLTICKFNTKISSQTCNTIQKPVSECMKSVTTGVFHRSNLIHKHFAFIKKIYILFFYHFTHKTNVVQCFAIKVCMCCL